MMEKLKLKINGVPVECDFFYLLPINDEPSKHHLVFYSEQDLPNAETVRVRVSAQMGRMRMNGRGMLFRDDEDDSRYSGIMEF